MNILCLMIKKDKSIQEISVDSTKSNFKFNNGLYTINKEAVNIIKMNQGGITVIPELIYVEGNPLPVNVTEGSVQDFLEHLVLKNALEQVAAPRSEFLDWFSNLLSNPGRLLLYGFVILIGGAIVWGFLHP